MRPGSYVLAALMLIGFLSVYSLSVSNLISSVNAFDYNDNKRPDMHYYADKTFLQDPINNKQVEIVKSFKNSTGFYKINGTVENQGAIILSDIQVIKYYKIPSVNDTTLICYEQKFVNCQYKSHDNQLPSKSFFLNIPDVYTKPE